MAKTFKQFFHENDQVSRLEDLLNVIDSTISTAKKEDDTLDPSHVESLKQQIGELYDQVMQAGKALPDRMQGDLGEPSRHIKTMRTLRGMQLPEATQQQIDEMLQLFSEQDQNKTAPNPFLKPKWAKARDKRETAPNPFLKPKWAKERDKRQAADQKRKVMSAFSRPKTKPNKQTGKEVAMKESDTKRLHPRDSFGQKWMRSVDELLGRKPQPKRSDVARDADIETAMLSYKDDPSGQFSKKIARDVGDPIDKKQAIDKINKLNKLSKTLDPDHPSQRINLSRVVHGDPSKPLFKKTNYNKKHMHDNQKYGMGGAYAPKQSK